jgi:NAD(P)-dependent dehydrogenase (short-subunit alcohol dehydrogenase family)
MKRLALITGIESSIAKSVCKKFLQKGYDVIVTHDKNNMPESKEMASFKEEIKDFVPIVFEYADLREKVSIKALLDRLKTRTFDVIVNCSSILAFTNNGELRDEFVDFDFDNFVEVIQYNIASIAAICIGLKDNLNQGACIVNITSSAAEEGAFATISYNASKSAIKNLTKSLANNFGGYIGVRVNSVAPGWIPASKNVVASGTLALANTLTPAKENGDPENVADTVFFLVNNPFVTGANIEVSGGITSSYLMYALESLELQGKLSKEAMHTLTKLLSEAKEKLGKV